ncbi:MAG: LON peptidase substrate-binding domain-containing protein [Verrucomicrobiae bacterium]|nr:LON peptidase substrate-binding domain-containing protein [Verrucomicrobiae bacterium]MCX7722791.1 LON peptidase substrate-binding domain-containing protein [Verrucomicrobiae bacterium]MDW7980447.1 LON peptidase substrate-binding domain-containing protein [Verrucomicrobiales bacterium]
MHLPAEAPVIVLPNVTLFPQALLPLFVSERRHRLMLADALEGHRVLCVAMQRPNCTREAPAAVGGLGLIRVAVRHDDGTSHVMLQGLVRVAVLGRVPRRRYRVHRIQPLPQVPGNEVVVEALIAKVRELVQERINLGLPFPLLTDAGIATTGVHKLPEELATELIKYLNQVDNPELVVDLVSCSMLRGAMERQRILETIDLETRLRYLVRFLRAEIKHERNSKQE